MSEPSIDSELKNPLVKKMQSPSKRIKKIQALKNEILQRLEVRNLYHHSKTVLKPPIDSELSVDGSMATIDYKG